MRSIALAVTFACLTIPLELPAQWEMVFVGNRVRVSTTDSVLRSPHARLGQLRQTKGTVTAIAPETLYVATTAADPPLAIPRILIFKVEVSRGDDRRGAIADAGFSGFGLGALLMSFFSDRLKPVVIGSGIALGALYGALFPYERWREALLPESVP